MTTSQLTPEQIAQVSGLVAEFIAAQRQRFSPQAAPLAAQPDEGRFVLSLTSHIARSCAKNL
jgi:hypothetical protein